MTDVLDRAEKRATRGWPTPRHRVRAAVLVVAVLVVGALVTVHRVHAADDRADHRYGPLVSGDFSGPYTSTNVSGDASAGPLRIVGGTGATAQWLSGLDNDGSHSVRVTSVETGDAIVDTQWSVFRTHNGGYVSGDDTRWQHFPAVIPAHGRIRLLTTVRRPAFCAEHPIPAGGVVQYYNDTHVVHWKSLLRDHVTIVDGALHDVGLRC